jgi:hypothetical protein
MAFFPSTHPPPPSVLRCRAKNRTDYYAMCLHQWRAQVCELLESLTLWFGVKLRDSLPTAHVNPTSKTTYNVVLTLYPYSLYPTVQQKVNKTHIKLITKHWGAFAYHDCRGKEINITYSACVRAHSRACIKPYLSRMQNNKRPIVTSFLVPMVPPNFSTLSRKRHDFRKKRYWI